MSRKFTQIKEYRRNEGYSCEISESDKKEILDLLNQKQFSDREFLPDNFEDLLSEIQAELKQEYNTKKGDECDWMDVTRYSENCHSLSRKMKERLKWEIVDGYIFDPRKFDGNDSCLTLTAHSISQDDSGNLIELTMLNDPSTTTFIPHKTGKCGIDLKAYR